MFYLVILTLVICTEGIVCYIKPLRDNVASGKENMQYVYQGVFSIT